MNSALGPIAAVILALFVTGYIFQSRLPPPKPKVIGIDLGTTFSCVGSYQSVSGNITIFDDADGSKTIPSVVYFTENGSMIVGRVSKEETWLPYAVLYDSKRFIGQQLQTEDVSALRKLYPFDMAVGEDHEVRFRVPINGSTSTFSAIQVGSFILEKLKSIAERHIGSVISQAVISVPAEFDAVQRNATVEAGRLAGLKVLRLINEPTAAAMAYGLHRRPGTHIIMVIDFGGGTLDVSLLSVQGGMFVTMAMAGNNRFGGQDINENLVRYVEGILEEKFGIATLDPLTLRNLNIMVEEAKLNLTNSQQALITLSLDRYRTGHVFQLPLSRDVFNSINAALFNKLLKPIETVLNEAELDRFAVDDVVLVGGSTRIPKVRAIVEEYFGKRAYIDIDPDLAVVTGVSLQAGIIGGMWPLQVAAIELPAHNVKKIDVTLH